LSSVIQFVFSNSKNAPRRREEREENAKKETEEIDPRIAQIFADSDAFQICVHLRNLRIYLFFFAFPSRLSLLRGRSLRFNDD
jgi:hypothetical protein